MKWSINTYFKNVLFKPRSENTHGLIGWMNWSLCNPLQAKLYLSVIDDVIESMRELFVEEGFEDRVLDDLRHVSLNCCPILWKQKKNKKQSTAELCWVCQNKSEVCWSSEEVCAGKEGWVLCLLRCSFGSQRWCSLKQWRTSGRTTSTRLTFCCSFLTTTNRPAQNQNSQVSKFLKCI